MKTVVLRSLDATAQPYLNHAASPLFPQRRAPAAIHLIRAPNASPDSRVMTIRSGSKPKPDAGTLHARVVFGMTTNRRILIQDQMRFNTSSNERVIHAKLCRTNISSYLVLLILQVFQANWTLRGQGKRRQHQVSSALTLFLPVELASPHHPKALQNFGTLHPYIHSQLLKIPFSLRSFLFSFLSTLASLFANLVPHFPPWSSPLVGLLFLTIIH